VARRRRLVALAWLSALGVIWPAAARAIDPDRALADCNVEIWRARDGLPGAWIRAIAQSPDGYLWVGTQGGLARYGGGPMMPVTADQPFEDAGDVMGLAAGEQGTVWLAPARGQPVCVRGGVLGPCFAHPVAALASARITDLAPDAAGAVWMATAEGIFRAAGGTVQRVRPASAWGGAPASAVHHDSHGRLWVGTGAGLFVGPAQGPGPLLLHNGPRGPVTAAVAALHPTRRGSLWVAADRLLLQITDGNTVSYADAEGLPPGRLTNLLEDRDGNLWVGSREGLIRFQPGRGFTRFGRPDGLPDGDVSALYEDREGSLWVGTRAGGLAQFTDRTLDRRSGPPSLRDLWVSTVAEDEAGVLWAATGRGLTRFAAGEERTYGRADGLPADEVLSVHPGAPGELWVGTARGLARFSGGRAEPVASLSTAVSALHRETDGTLWIGDAQGLARLQDGRLDRFDEGEQLERGDLGAIRSIGRDDQGVVWIAANGKLRRLDGAILRRDPSPIVATITKVRAMARDADGTLWLGTGEGLVRRRRGTWRGFATAEGFGRSDLFQVVPDDHGFLWVGATHGILRVSRRSLEEVERGQRSRADVVTFEIADEGREVRVSRTRQPGAWKGADGRLRFASSRGVVTVDPRRLPVNAVAPPVLIEKALVDGRPAQRGNSNHFPPGSGALEFHFAAITLIEPRKAQHRYRLEGFDPGWVEAGTRRAAYYTNIRPGRYRFRVQGSNADGVWNQSGDVLELALAPHFFQTGWFYALGGLLALTLALSVHRLRVSQLRARHQATSAERARMARELHDSLLQGMAAALMHLRGLRKRFAPDASPTAAGTVAQEIKQIEELVAGNIEETRQAVWDLRESARGDRAPGDEGILVEELEALVGRLRAGSNDAASVRTLVQGRALLVPRQVRHELLRIVHEAVTNALKHAGAGSIEVGLHYQEGSVRLRVCDDGRGFDPAGAAGVHSGHFGLTGMRERASLLGQFRVEPRPGGGTMVEVTANLKDLRDV
jgi:ligand-binding sensor domain-containing protein/signal transduction histidine kinase